MLSGSKAKSRLVVATFALVAWLFASAAIDVDGETTDSAVQVVFRDSDGNEITQEEADSNPGSARIEEWRAAALCISAQYRNDLLPGCPHGATAVVRYCLDGTRALDPWWMRYRIGNGPWSPWSAQSGYRCPQESQLENLIREAWANMPITPNVITVQPDTGWVLTTVPTIVYVDRAPRRLNVTLLGVDVIIRATPTSYRWTWGDGAHTTTSSPGAPYPNQSVTHTYLYDERNVTIRLTTTWAGSFSINGGDTWRRAPGTATTVSIPVTVHVYNPHSHEVNCDTLETCVA